MATLYVPAGSLPGISSPTQHARWAPLLSETQHCKQATKNMLTFSAVPGATSSLGTEGFRENYMPMNINGMLESKQPDSLSQCQVLQSQSRVHCPSEDSRRGKPFGTRFRPKLDVSGQAEGCKPKGRVEGQWKAEAWDKQAELSGDVGGDSGSGEGSGGRGGGSSGSGSGRDRWDDDDAGGDDTNFVSKLIRLLLELGCTVVSEMAIVLAVVLQDWKSWGVHVESNGWWIRRATTKIFSLLFPAILCCHLANSPAATALSVKFVSATNEVKDDIGSGKNGKSIKGKCSEKDERTEKGEAESLGHLAGSDNDCAIWEVKGNRWRRYNIGQGKEYVLEIERQGGEQALYVEMELERGLSESLNSGDRVQKDGHEGLSVNFVREKVKTRVLKGMEKVKETLKHVLLPAGFPASVTEDYIEYTGWKMGQVTVSETSRVLTTQALLYAVGLGRGAIPSAAALSWVLRDGMGYFAKIALAKYGRHFDVSPKGWRLAADVTENLACGLELLTPSFPHHFFYLASAATAGLSAAGLIQAATKSCFYAGFAAQRNFAELIAKGEAQGMASKSVGIALGIFLSARVGPRGPLLAATYAALASCHLYCNLRSYQAVQLRTLNPYRAGLVLTEYFRSGRVPGVREVNSEEPIFTRLPFLKLRKKLPMKGKLSKKSIAAAGDLATWVYLGAPLGSVVSTQGEAAALSELYRGEKYCLATKGGKAHVVLREGATPRDLLRAMVQAAFLHHLRTQVEVIKGGVVQECGKGGALRVSKDFVKSRFDEICEVLEGEGWIANGLVARPGPSRLVESL